MDVFHEKRQRGQDDRARDARHGDGPGALPPRDADPRRRAALHRRPRGGGAALLPAQLRRRRRPDGRRASRAAVPDVHARRGRRLARGRGRRARRERRAGRADRAERGGRGARGPAEPGLRAPRPERRRRHGVRLQHDAARGRRAGRRDRGRRAGADRRDDREPARARALLRRLLGLPQAATRATSRCRCMHLLDFVVYGTRPGPGSCRCARDVEAVAEPETRA